MNTTKFVKNNTVNFEKTMSKKCHYFIHFELKVSEIAGKYN